MPAPSGNQAVAPNTSSRVSELGLVLPAPPTPLGAYFESSEVGHVRLVYGVQSLPIGAPLIVDVIFEVEPLRHSTSKQHSK